MKVISGKYKGHKIKGYDIEGTRPTMDRVKESMCAMIMPYLKNSNCLDLFAGSGAVGIEFISNGALKCTFVELNKKMYGILKDNISSLSIDSATIFNCHYEKFLDQTKDKYNIIFLDPPYNSNYINKVLEKIELHDLLYNKGFIIIETEKENIITDLALIRRKKYGNKEIQIYQKTS